MIPSPLRIALMGAPGVGKGTFASRLIGPFGIPAISTGDLVRKEISMGTPIGKQIKEITEKGMFVSDGVVGSLLSSRLKSPDCQKGFFLDGFPRKISQTKTLREILPIPNLHLVVNFDLPDDILVRKITARRVCPSCGRNYNLADISEGDIVMPPLLPKVSGQCDEGKCHGEKGILKQRADDTESVVRNRLSLYWKETFPLLEFYKNEGILLNFKVKKGIADTPKLIEEITQFITKNTQKK